MLMDVRSKWSVTDVRRPYAQCTHQSWCMCVALKQVIRCFLIWLFESLLFIEAASTEDGQATAAKLQPHLLSDASGIVSAQQWHANDAMRCEQWDLLSMGLMFYSAEPSNQILNKL